MSKTKAVKSVRFGYKSTPVTRELLSTFRSMVNEAIGICLEEDVRGRLRLRDRIYKEFQNRYGVVSVFPYSVAEVAWSIVKKHRRWNRKPFAKRLMMKMDSYNYTLNHSILSLPFKRGQRILLPLEFGDYQRAFMMDSALRRGSVTLTEHSVIVAFTREVYTDKPLTKKGIDINEKSVVCSDGARYDLSEVARMHTEYGIRRKQFYQKHALDSRVKKKFAGSLREKERIRQVLHRKAKEIVKAAKSGKQAIILEKLKGIRYAHQRGNGEGRRRRRRIACWSFSMLQAFILYKARWEGVQVEFVSAAYTSQTCNKCNRINRSLKLTEREWRCPSCGATLDRDLNAAINIGRRGTVACLGEVRPGAQGTDEAMKGNEQPPAPILRAEALKLT